MPDETIFVMVHAFALDDEIAVTNLGKKADVLLSTGEWRIAFEQTHPIEIERKAGLMYIIRFERITGDTP